MSWLKGWRKNRLTMRGEKTGLSMEWFPLVRFGRHPRWALWLVRYENPKRPRAFRVSDGGEDRP